MLYFLFLSYINIRYLRKNTSNSLLFNGPKISILVPARNEANNIRRCVLSLLQQNYDNYEVIVIDDNSTDNTLEILQEIQQQHPNLQIISGQPLKSGWFGKAYAMQQLLQHATGEYCLFVDSDTEHKQNMLAFSSSNILQSKADLMSGYTQYTMRNLGEKFILPSIYLMLAMVFPFFLIRSTKTPRNSFSVGMYMMYKTTSLRKLGGFEAVRNDIDEDIMITRHFKKNGLRTHFIDAKSVVVAYMYDSFAAAYQGISKNLYPAADKNLLEAGLIVLLISVLFLLPIALFVESLLIGIPHWLLLLPIAGATIMWSMVMHNRKHPIYYGFTYWLLMLALLAITLTSTKKIAFGKGVLWKGRLVK